METIKILQKEVGKSKLTIRQLAQETGLNIRQIHRLKHKSGDVYTGTADRLLKYFGYTISKKARR